MSLNQSWQKAEIISKIIGAMVLPLLLALAAFGFDSVLKNRELRAKNFELAVSILRNEPSLVDENLWMWATTTFNELATVKPNINTQSSIVNNGLYTVPVAEFISRELRAWLAEDYAERNIILSDWLKSKSLKISPTLFLIQDKYAPYREHFLRDQGVWE